MADGASSVLVAGGCGFLGSHLIDRLLLRQGVDRIVVVDNLWTGLRSNLAHITDPRVHLVVADVETFSTAERFDEIIHFASPASPPWYMREPVRTITANVQGGINLLGKLKPGGRFSFASTSEVYGDPLISPQPESYRGSVDCTGPRSSYDESKRCTESLLFETRRIHGIDTRIIRLFNVYGPRTRIDDGRAVSNFIGQALGDGVLTVYGDGMQSRSFGFVDDIVEALSRYFWRDEIAYPGPLNIGNDREVPVLDIARFIAGLVPGSTIRFMPPVPQDPTNRRPDLTLCNAVLPGWRADTPYEEGIRRTMDWFRGQLAMVDEAPRPPEPVFVDDDDDAAGQAIAARA
ncbi:NAD-dependent epimerase/dehydratase family protein [Sphingomonas sp. Leaf412]|uniref:NAD-dependent epimerase/dehydratase family protein n=1 Tax=Sphingomonas sp. Leaf412 TaxID=1736370 RepID=UPI0009EB1D54|nr:NAD-dependent epimerase/dehydratase family protein [Sphingomonas sp. Leaf412]